VTSSAPAVGERLALTSAVLMAKGMDALSADRASLRLLAGAVAREATVIAFDRAFASSALLFVVAAPVLVTIKIGLTRHAARVNTGARGPRSEASNGPD
jgi:DHA2 family multidrug resistance protein